MSDTPTLVATKPPSYRIKPARFKAQVHGYENTEWRAIVEFGTPYEEVLKTDFWAHVAEARQVKIGDDIIVVPDDVSYRAHLFVRDVGPKWVKVTQLDKIEFDSTPLDSAESTEFKVEWKGPHHKHAIVRISDNQLVQTGFKTAADARLGMADHIKAMAA
jgi:hypothetical protein